MQWKRLSYNDKVRAKKEYNSHWHRRFAWGRCWDQDSKTVYWLQFVWERGLDWAWFPTDNDGHKNGYFKRWEYRGGRSCPNIKQPPTTKESTDGQEGLHQGGSLYE